MDFEDTPQEAAFRTEVRAFLAANAEPKKRGVPARARHVDAEALAHAKRFQAAKHDAGLVGITWNDRRMNDYYFGVSTREATPERPAYRAGAGTQLQAGINGAWPVGNRGSLLFGLMATRLGNAQADSPIVETRIQPLAYAGYGWTF